MVQGRRNWGQGRGGGEEGREGQQHASTRRSQDEAKKMVMAGNVHDFAARALVGHAADAGSWRWAGRPPSGRSPCCPACSSSLRGRQSPGATWPGGGREAEKSRDEEDSGGGRTE